VTELARRAVCHFCHSRCRVMVYSENGHMTKIEEDPTYPIEVFPPRKACLKLRGTKEWLYHKDHLNYPLKRLGDRGEGKWQQISWDQAFDEIADKLQKIKEQYGPEAIGLLTGTLRTRGDLQARFFHLLGSPNYAGAPNICHAPNVVMGAIMTGWPHRVYTSVVLGTTTKCFLLVGIDPQQSITRLWKPLRDAKKSGLKLIVIDPRRTQTAEIADLWLQPRPATDTALLLSMINVIIEEGLYDREFVEKWCYGFDKLRERAREYPPEKVADIAWVEADMIREAARMYATNKPAGSLHGMGVEHHNNHIQAIQARYALCAITGNIDVAGGSYMPGPAECITEPEMELSELLPVEQKRKQLGADRFKVLSFPAYDLISEHVRRVWGKTYYQARSQATGHAPTLYRAMLTSKPYPVRAAMSIAANPMVTMGNVKLVYRALKSLDLLTVWDYFMTPTAELADYVLPVASWLERPFLYTISGADNIVTAGEQALPATIPGEYERKNDYEILRELGIRLGQAEYWPWENLEELYDYQLKPTGMTFQEFLSKTEGLHIPPNKYKKYEEIGFATPTGKVELYSIIFEKLGYDPLPYYEESHENPISRPDLAKNYPLILINGGRTLPYFHSEHRQVESIRRKYPHPIVQINPETAAEWGIRNGDWCWIETPRGKIRMKCQHFDGIDPRVVHCEHGWWYPELPGEEPWLHGVWESNVNVLTDDDPDACNKYDGGWPLKTALCKVYPCETY
jgi:thiosulfate reductase/polysulfide reductase chain A